jgi:hypothetical protein
MKGMQYEFNSEIKLLEGKIKEVRIGHFTTTQK